MCAMLAQLLPLIHCSARVYLTTSFLLLVSRKYLERCHGVGGLNAWGGGGTDTYGRPSRLS